MLPANLELAVVQTYGYWAQVRARNGWQGWVDVQHLVGLPHFGMQPVALTTSRRTKIAAVVGGLMLITFLVAAAVFGYAAAHSPKTPVDGPWGGVETSATAQKLLVQFRVTGAEAGQVSIAFWDPSDNFYSWTCADSPIDNGTFKALKCLSDWGDDAPTVDVGGTFDASDDIEGTYQVTVLGTTWTGAWSGMPA